MPPTVSLGSLLKTLARKNALGRYVTGIDPDNVAGSAFTLTDSHGSAPVTGGDIPVKSQVIFTSPCDSGTSTTSTTTVLTDSSKSWTVDEWIGFVLSVDGWRVVITDSDATTLTYAALDEAPALGHYSIDYGTSFVSRYVPSTGVVSLSPTLGTLNAAQTNNFTAVIFEYLDHPKQAIDAINQALTERCWRIERRPLTFVPDGDLQGERVTDYWTAAANGTAAYVSAQTYSTTGDAAGQTSVNRLLQLTSSGGATSVDGNGIRVIASTQQRTWKFFTAIRLVSGAGTATFSWRDNTNSADITLQVTRGNDSHTLTTTTFGDFMVCEGTFQLPTTCAEIAPRLALSATGMVGQMGPIIAFPMSVTSFPLPNRIASIEDIGNFYHAYTLEGPSTLNAVAFSDPITTSGLEHRIYDFGDHKTVTFNFQATDRPIFYDEFVYGTELTGMADTTTFDEEYIVRWAAFEIYDWLMRKKMNADVHLANGQAEPTNFRHLRNAALVAAQGLDGPPVHILGRR